MTKTEQRIRELESEAKVLEHILDTSGDDLPDVETELCAIYKELAGYE